MLESSARSGNAYGLRSSVMSIPMGAKVPWPNEENDRTKREAPLLGYVRLASNGIVANLRLADPQLLNSRLVCSS